MATSGTITIDNPTYYSDGYDTNYYKCASILQHIYTSAFKEYLLNIEVTVGGTYYFPSNANGMTCYIYNAQGPMQSFGVVKNGTLTISTLTLARTATTVQNNPAQFSRISFGCGNASAGSASIRPNSSGSGQFYIVMNFNIPDWFVAGEPIAQTNDSAHQIKHNFIQYFYSGTIYTPFRINAGNVAVPFNQQILDDSGIIKKIGTTGTVMSATIENTLLYSTYAHRSFTS